MPSNDAVKSSKLNAASASKTLAPITLASFLDPRNPWVLIPDGNLLGFFSWVPKHLRIGPWSKLTIPTAILLLSILFLHRPTTDYDHLDTLVSSYPSAYSRYWWYNSLACVYMSFLILWIAIQKTKGIAVTFTVLSWFMNTLRHGINALAPFLYDDHSLLKLNHILRFPALVSATLTFAVWNCVLLPYIYFYAMKGHKKEKKDDFMIWNFNFRMGQLHVSNVIYAVFNTLVTGSRKDDDTSPPLFDKEDVWYGVTYGFLYGLFYMLILDRIGVHLYPIFSPRLSLGSIAWVLVFGLHVCVCWFWNYIMLHHWKNLLRFEVLVGFNCVIVGVCAMVHFLLNKKRKQT